MISRFFTALNVGLLGFVISTNTHAALASANVTFDWTTLNVTVSDNLSVIMIGPMGDDGGACADGAPCDSGSTTSFGGLNLSSIGPSSNASLMTTADLIDASAATTLGFGSSTFERFFSFEALFGSGSLTLSVDVVLQSEVQGAGSSADAEALFGYEIGESGVGASLAGLEMYGYAGDQSQTLSTTLSFAVFMSEGDVIDMFGEGGAEVSAVPIPAATWLFGSGLIGLFAIAKGRKKID